MYCVAFMPVFTFVTGLICSNTAAMNLLELSHQAPASISLRSKLRQGVAESQRPFIVSF